MKKNTPEQIARRTKFLVGVLAEATRILGRPLTYKDFGKGKCPELTAARFNRSGYGDKLYGLASIRAYERAGLSMVKIREHLGHEVTDARKMPSHAAAMRSAGARHHAALIDVGAFLVGEFGVEMVHRESSYDDDARRRTDFKVYPAVGATPFAVDLVTPLDAKSRATVVRSKLRKLAGIGWETVTFGVLALVVDATPGADVPWERLPMDRVWLTDLARFRSWVTGRGAAGAPPFPVV